MISFWRIFWLETVALVRSKSLWVLAAAVVGWTLLAPAVITGDGTAAGARALELKYSLGGATLLAMVTMTIHGAGSLALERAAKRLQLALVRPAPRLALVGGRVLAAAAAAAAVIALAALVVAARHPLSQPCRHVLRPQLPEISATAERLYEHLLKAETSAAEMKRLGRAAALRVLTQRIYDNYDAVPTNAAIAWRIAPVDASGGASVRLRFTHSLGMREQVRGRLEFGGASAEVDCLTQAVMEFPLRGEIAAAEELKFENLGAHAVLFRPRRDVEVLVPADGFGWNLLRAWAELAALATLLIALAVFLGGTLSRPVAVFTLLVVLLVSEAGPDVIDRNPEEIMDSAIDRFGLFVTRTATTLTRPFSSVAPLARLGEDECIERGEMTAAVTRCLALAFLFTLLTAALLPRKPE